MRRVKTPEQLKAWREKGWKPLGYRTPTGNTYLGFPIHTDEPHILRLALKTLAYSGLTADEQRALDDWVEAQLEGT